MKSIARLVYMYFTSSPQSRWLSGVGATGLVAMGIAIVVLPHALDAWGMLVVVISWGLLFLGSTFMPLILGNLIQSRHAGLLPGGRQAIYWSALITVVILSFPIPFLSVFALMRIYPSPTDISTLAFIGGLWSYFGPSFFMTSWFYVAIAFIVRSRSLASVVLGMLMLLLVVFLPMKRIMTGDAALLMTLLACIFTWLLFAAVVFGLPRLRQTAFATRMHQKWKSFSAVPRVRSGREVDIMLGIATPWALALPIVVPALLSTTLGKYSISAWLLMMTIFSTVTGAIAAYAAGRSRAIWLRTRWSREQLFEQVERRFWRHNGVTLAALVAVPAVLVLLGQLRVGFLVAGLPLILLGMTLSTYLGLMQTQSLRLRDAALGGGVMLALMLLAVIAAEDGNPPLVYQVEFALAALALALRFVARGRWTGLDWRLCRATERATAARSLA
jgi:hypothetical protein